MVGESILSILFFEIHYPKTRNMSKLFPTLSAIGWTDILTEKLDFALSHWFAAEPSLSYLYHDGEHGAISVQRMIAENPTDIDKIVNDIAVGLTSYLSTIFDKAEVLGVNLSKEKNDKDDRSEIKVEIRVQDDNEVIQDVRFAYFRFNRFVSITRVNNYGDVY